MDHVVAGLVAAEHPALDQPHAAGAAHPGAAIMRQLDAVQQRPIQQEIAGIGEIALVVEHDLADPPHHSTSSRLGRTWRVGWIWLWSNAATRMKTPLAIATSSALPVSSRRTTSSDQRPEAQRAAQRMSARSPESSPARITPGMTV